MDALVRREAQSTMTILASAGTGQDSKCLPWATRS